GWCPVPVVSALALKTGLGWTPTPHRWKWMRRLRIWHGHCPATGRSATRRPATESRRAQSHSAIHEYRPANRNAEAEQNRPGSAGSVSWRDRPHADRRAGRNVRPAAETLSLLLLFFRSALEVRRNLALENLALRQQLAVLKRTQKRPAIRDKDRVFWVWLSRFWREWRESLVIKNLF